MSKTSPSQTKKDDKWPRKVTIGHAVVTVYKGLTPAGNPRFRVQNYSTGERRYDPYKNEADAMDAATRLARQLSQMDVISASMTREQSIEYASAVQSLQPLGLTLSAAVAAIVEAVQEVGDLPTVGAAIHFYKTKHTPIVEKKVYDVIAEMMTEKKARKRKERTLLDYQYRLDKFAEAFPCNISDVKAIQIQAWLDGHKTGAQNYQHNRTVVNTLCNWAKDKKRRYLRDNPVDDVDKLDIDEREPDAFTPDEARSLMAKVTEDFLPCIAIGLFAGLRSSEIQLLDWAHIDFKEGHIKVPKDIAKKGVRRFVPIHDNLLEWLAPYKDRNGSLWQFGDDAFDKRLSATAKAAGLEWKHNGLRHSFISYAVAMKGNVAEVAYWSGNSPKMIEKHYLKHVSKGDAEKFFDIRPPKVIQSLAVPMLPDAATV